MTYTYAIQEVTAPTYDEIKRHLAAVGYDHAFHEDDEHGLVIDMHGIALARQPRERAIDAAEMFGELIGRYRDHWPAVCASRGLPDCDISFTSLTAVLDTLVESVKAGAP